MSTTGDENTVRSSQICTLSEAPVGSSFVVIVDSVCTSAPDYKGLFSHFQWEFLKSKILRTGVSPDSLHYITLDQAKEVTIHPRRLILGMGEQTLRHYTSKRGIDKWHLSPLDSLFTNKFIPTFSLDRMQKQPELGLYIELAFRRAAEECGSPAYDRAPERFRLNPSLEETLAVLKELEIVEEVAVDVETGYGQINTVGFAWSASDAIAINVLPDRCGDEAYFELWSAIARVLEGPARKIFQNFIYDVSYFSAYGIRVENIDHDTMWGMKFLYPELDMNLGNVGRIFTKRPYWKDDGKVESEEGQRKDWGNVRDWPKHYLYNCRDTSGTFEAKQGQRKELRARGLESLFDNYLMELALPVLEMSSNGMPLCLETREKLKVETEARVLELTTRLHCEAGFELNPRSSKQKMSYLEGLGVSMPKKYDKASGGYKKTADANALKKIRLKRPDIAALSTLLDLSGLEKALSSYINFDVKPGEALCRYSLGKFTETLRFASGTDPWDRGINIQTIPREGGEVSIKSMFVAPEGFSFLECDLRQAESRFVAYDAADKTLIDMLESGADVHTHVGRAILKQMGRDPDVIPKDEFKSTWRQLGKKAGHGLNYSMKANVFVETVFNELDLVIQKKDAELITEAYHTLFPGIPRWHAWIRSELNLKRKLSAPSGWERYFYGRFGDDMFKEAYAWRPQHTIPWITNRLMLHLIDRRRLGEMSFHLLLQGHDALYLLIPDDEVEKVARVCLNHKIWHPEVTLPGGRLLIPTEVKTGRILSELTEFRGE